MALRLDYGVDMPGSDQTAVMPLPEQMPLAAPLTGLPAALPQATPGAPAGLPSSSSDFYDAIKKALILELQQTTQPQQKEEPKKGLGWMALIPGYAEGLQQRQAFEQHQETLKLQQQAMKGQQASQQLQRLVTLHTLQQQQQQEEMGKQVGQLFAQGKDLSDPTTQQEVLGAMLRAGLPLDQVLKLQQYLAQQRELSQNAQVGAGGALPAQGAPAATPQTEGAAPPPTGTQGSLPQAPATARFSSLTPVQQKIVTKALQLGINPAVALAQAHQESGGTFDNSITGKAGEIGIMQILPSTGKELGYTPEQLRHEDTNIDVGLRYLKQRGSLKAYNGGGDPNYEANVGRFVPQYTQALQRMPLPTGGQTLATSAGAPALPGQPSRGQEAMQLDLARLMAQREQLMQVQQALRALRPITEAGRKDIDTRMDNVRQDLTALNTNIQQVQQQMEPGDLFKSMLRQNQGNLALTQQQYMDFEIEKAQKTQESGLKIAAQRAAETERAKMEAAQGVRGQQTLVEVEKDDSGNYLDTRTGEPINQATLYQDALAAVKSGTVKRLTKEQSKQYDQVQSTVPVLGEIRTLLDRVYEPGGIFENLSPEERAQAAVRGGWARLTQTNPDLVELNRLMAGNIDFIRRNFQGQVGTQTEGDAKRGLAAMADVTGIPDSKEVAYRLYNTMLETVNRMQGRLLGNKRFQNSELAPLGRSRPGALTTQEEGLLQKYQR